MTTLTLVEKPADSATGEQREALIARWRAASTERERADIENTLWTAATAQERERAKTLYGFLQPLLGGVALNFALRMRLRSLALPKDELWQAVDEKRITLGIAARILAPRARALAKAGASDPVGEALHQWDAAPTLRIEGGFRYKHLPPLTFGARAGARAASAPPLTVWPDFRDAVAAYVRQQTMALDPIYTERCMADISRDVQALVDEWRSKILILRARSDEVASATSGVSRRDLAAACQTLGVDPPRLGRPLTPAAYARARKHKKQLAREYHPDSHGGDQTWIGRFHAVISAWEALNSYQAHVLGVRAQN